MFNALNLLRMPLFIEFLKILREKNKTYFDDDVLGEELLKYIVLNKKKTDYIMIKKLKNILTALKVLLEYENKIQEVRGLNFEEEEQVKKELNELETKKDEELKLLESLNCERVWRKVWESDFNINDEIKLREKTSQRISKIEKLRRKREIDLENLFDIDNRAIDLLMEVDIDKKDRQEELILIEIKLEKLKLSNYVNLLSIFFLIIRFIIRG